MRSVDCILIFFLSSILSLSFSLFPFLSTAIVVVITIFLRSPSGLSSNDLSIESRVGNHRTSANGTANDCVLLVPLNLPHYTQFFAGDLIGFPLLIPLFHSLLLPVHSPLRAFFFHRFVRVFTYVIDRKIPFSFGH